MLITVTLCQRLIPDEVCGLFVSCQLSCTFARSLVQNGLLFTYRMISDQTDILAVLVVMVIIDCFCMSRLNALHMFFGACWVILCFHNLPISGMDYKMTGSLTHICDVFACVSTWGTSSIIRVVFNWDFHSVLCVLFFAILVAGPALLMWNDQ